MSAAVGDVDGDGDLDAFVGNYNQGNKVWLNDGSGHFTDSGQSLGSHSGHAVAMGDLDADRDLDVFVANWANQPDRVWLNDGAGNFTDSGQTLGNSGTLTVALGDVDGDDDLDAFVGNADINGGGVPNKVWLNDGAGQFTDSGQSLGNSDSVGVVLSDLDSDGDLDAFVGNTRNEANTVWINDGSGRFTDSGQTLGNSSSYGIASGDVDDDGDLDLFVGNQGDNKANKVWLNDGTGGFTDSGQTLGSSASRAASLADLDFDSDLDVFVANQDGASKVWLNDGTGHFTDAGQKLRDSSSKGLALGDLDGDEDLDAFIGNDNQPNKVWLNKEKCPANQICNGGFEQGVEYWNYSGDLEIVSPGRTGDNRIGSSQERTPTQSPSWAGVSQEMQVVPGQIYNYRFWVKSENAAGGHLKFIWLNAADEEVGVSYPVRGISGDLNDWTEFDGQVTAPLTASKAEMILWHGVNQGVNVPGSTLWVDDITVTPTPNVVGIYALAFDNSPTSSYSLAANFPETMQSIFDATVGAPDKMAIVLIDLPSSGNTHIRVVHNGAETLVAGLPDVNGNLSLGLDEYDMADGATLGGFLKWALENYTHQNSKTIFSYVGHGSALVPETDLEQILPDQIRALLPTPSIPLPSCYNIHPNATDYDALSILSAHDLAVALEFATNDGQNPIDVLDLLQCFSASIEQFYELSNPDGVPYATTISGAPNYTYLNPRMLGVALAASSPSDDAAALADTLLDTYNTLLAEDDSDPSRHPRLLVAMDSSKIADIQDAWDNMSILVADEFALNHQETKDKIRNAYLASAKYDTTFCESDWSLDAPDGLVDMVDFAYKLSDEFGVFSGAGTWAEATKIAVEEAIIAKHYTNGQPWFANVDPLPTWNFDNHDGISLYADFQGMILDNHPGAIMLNWQAHWYTDTVSVHNPEPYAFVRDTRWDTVIHTFWKGENVETMACMPPLPPALRSGEVSADRILLPLRGMVTKNYPVSPSVVISVSGEETPFNPLVEFSVTQNNTIVFSDTVSAGTLVTGTYQVEASQSWLPDSSGPFTLTVTVDADNRVQETNESDNQIVVRDRVLSPLSQPRPVIEAQVKDGAQWVTTPDITLDLSQSEETSGTPLRTLAIQLYQYEAGDNPNSYVPVELDTQVFRDVSLSSPEFSLTLPEGTPPGPVVLHVWAISAGGLSVAPQIIEFNYVPLNSLIEAGKEQHFIFRAQKGESLQLDLNVQGDEDANLFVWDPHTYGRPIWRGTYAGNDTITIDPAPANGKYVVSVYGETNATYSLNRATSARGMAQESRLQNNSDPYVPEGRPTFIEPTPEVPDGDLSASEIRISNVRDVSFTASWLTEWESTGEVRYGTDPNDLNQTAYDKRGADINDEIHYVMINDLLPETTYYFDIVSGTTTDDNGGTHYTITTGPTLNVPGPDTIYGPVKRSDGSTPAAGTIVYLTLQDADGAGSSGEAAPLSALVDENGDWVTNLSNARSADFSQRFLYSASGDQLHLEAQGGADGSACQRLNTSQDSPAPATILNQQPCTITATITIKPGWNFIALPVEPKTPITAEMACDQINSQGGDVLEIDRWHMGGWEGHVCGRPFNNVELDLAEGYFIKANQASSWSIEGTPVTIAQELNLQASWNSISVPHTDGYIAESLCDEIITQGVTAVEVTRWANGGWEGHPCGQSFNNFDIEPDKGYFVKATSSGTITPTLPASLRQPKAPVRAQPQTKPVPELVEGQVASVVEVRDLQISNLRDTSLTLSWLTDQATTGYVLYGQTTELGQIAYDVRDATVTDETHYVTLSDLTPETTYYFKVISGAEQDEQALSTVTTAATLESLPDSDTIYGQLFEADGVTPATGTLVYLILQDQDENGSNGQSMLQSALVDANGNWHHNLGNARVAAENENRNASHTFQYNPTRDTVALTAKRKDTIIEDTRTINQLRPAEALILPDKRDTQIYLPFVTR